MNKDHDPELGPNVPMGKPENLAGIFYELDNNSINNRTRPYDGQPWTNDGERGKQDLCGLTMRDVQDCLAIAFLRCCEGSAALADSPEATWNDVFEATETDPHFDPKAVGQNVTCELEKRLGVYPNLPDAILSSEGDER